MIFYKEAFRLFYEALLGHFRDNEFPDMPAIKNLGLSKDIWRTLVKGELSFRALKIARTHSKNPDVFYELLHRGTYLKKSDLIIIAGLKYLGITLPKSLSDTRLNPQVEVQVLFQFFLESRAEDGWLYLDTYKDLTVYDHATESLITNTKKHEDDDQELIKKDTDKTKTSIDEQSLKSEILDTVTTFFKLVLIEDLNKAALLLNPYLNPKLDSQSFILTYRWTTYISNFNIISLDILDKNELECKIYFDEEIDLEQAIHVTDNTIMDYDVKRFYEMVEFDRKIGMYARSRKQEYIPMLEEKNKGFKELLNKYLELRFSRAASAVRIKPLQKELIQNVLLLNMIKYKGKWLINSIYSIKS